MYFKVRKNGLVPRSNKAKNEIKQNKTKTEIIQNFSYYLH